MVVYYGYKYYLKEDKTSSSVVKCPNCGHEVKMTMAKEKCKLHIFFIPFFVATLRRAKICPCCGAVKTYKAREYKEALKQMY